MPALPQQPPALVLVVDDQAYNLQVVGKTLGERGYEIKFARNGNEALAVAEADPPDLILLDVMMPDVDGFDVCQRLKLNPLLASVPVIFLTARTDDSAIMRGFELGAVDYLTKPFRAGELLARVQTHVRLRRATEELRRLNARKSEFLGIAAHDMKNPLTAIVGLAESCNLTIEDAAGEPTPAVIKSVKANLETIGEAAQHMLGVIAKIMDSEAIESGRLSLHRESRSFADLASVAVELSMGQADRKRQRLVTELDPKAYAVVDANRMIEVMDNLLSNAVKYSPLGGRIWVRVGIYGNKVRFSVKDEGPGISAEDRKRMFGRFARLSAKPTGGEASSGLGLSIVKQLVELQGGTVWVESTPGKGAEFAVEFPASSSQSFAVHD